MHNAVTFKFVDYMFFYKPQFNVMLVGVMQFYVDFFCILKTFFFDSLAAVYIAQEHVYVMASQGGSTTRSLKYKIIKYLPEIHICQPPVPKQTCCFCVDVSLSFCSWSCPANWGELSGDLELRNRTLKDKNTSQTLQRYWEQTYVNVTVVSFRCWPILFFRTL